MKVRTAGCQQPCSSGHLKQRFGSFRRVAVVVALDPIQTGGSEAAQLAGESRVVELERIRVRERGEATRGVEEIDTLLQTDLVLRHMRGGTVREIPVESLLNGSCKPAFHER